MSQDDDELFKYILDRNPVPTVVLKCPTLEMTYRNSAAARMIGYDVSTLAESTLLIRPEDLANAIDSFQAGGEETSVIRRNDHVYRVSLRRRAESIQAVIQIDHLDLVAESRALFDCLPLIVSQRSKIDMFHNQAYFTFTGQNKNDPSGVSYLNAVHEDDREEFQKIIYEFKSIQQSQDTGKSGDVHVSHSHRLRSAAGDYRWVKTEALMSAGLQTFLTFDIHEVHLKASRLANQEMLLQLEKQENRRLLDQESVAKEGNRLKGEFLAHTSHEIRTPIAGVIGMVELLLDTELDSEQTDYAESIRSSANALLTVINDVLDFSKIEAGKMQIETLPFELTQVTKDIEMMVSFMAAKKSLSFSIDMDPSIVFLLGDRGRIRQILLNLLSNAIKFTQKGSVKLSVIREEENAASMKVRFIVTDTGSGMSEQTLKQLFQPFAQGDAGRIYGGTGLGLSICKKLIELLQGEIGTESVQGRGTTFWFWLKFQKARSDQIKAMDGTTASSASAQSLGRTAVRSTSSSTPQAQTPPASSPSGTPLTRQQSTETMADPYNDAGASTGQIEHLPEPSLPNSSIRSARPNTFDRNPSTSSVMTLKGPRSDNESPEFSLEDDVTEESLFYDDKVSGNSTEPRDTPTCSSFSDESQLHPQTGFERSPVPHVIHGSSDGSVASTMRTASTQASKDKRILLAEDNDINCKIATSMLRKLGYACTVVKNGQEAVDAIDEQSSFDLILMDVQMPVLNGFEATALIRKSQNVSMRTIPVIALTASAISGDREKCLDAGMDDYLTKPVDKKQLEKKLNKWLDL